MRSTDSHARWQTVWFLVLALAMLVAVVPGAPDSLADGGDFSLDFRAAAPFSYTHSTGGGAWNDGTNTETGDTREELEGGQFACGDIVTYLTEIVVDPGATPDNQTIELDYSFLAETTGQPGAAHVDVVYVGINYGQVENGDNGDGTNPGPGEYGLDSGISDDRQTIDGGDTEIGGSTARIISESFDPPGTEPFGSPPAQKLLLTVEVDDLEPGETVILRIDVKLGCDPNSSPTGNLQAKFDAGRVVSPTPPAPDTIPGGEQTIPFKQIGNLATEADLGIAKSCPTFTLVDFDFEIVVTNYGPASANSLTLSDTLVAGLTFSSYTSTVDGQLGGTCTVTGQDVSCTLDELIYQGTWMVNIQVTVDVGTLPPGSPVPNTATIASLTSDPSPDPHANSDTANCTTPVTLASFQATESGNGVRFEWSTATELGNVGFHLYEQTEDGPQRVNEDLILSHVVNSVLPQDYSFEATGIAGDFFFVEDVDVLGRTQLHGPFELGKAYGAPTAVEPIDWAAIRAEHAAGAMVQSDQGSAKALEQAVGAPVSQGAATKGRGVQGADDQVNLLVDRDGLYRVTYQQLLAAGFDLNGAKSSDLALANRSQPVPIHVEAGLTFGPGSYIEFYGTALDTLYTRTNVYVLQVDRKLASRVAVDSTPVPGGQPAPFYMETVTFENDRAYSIAASNGDPWFDTMLLAYGAPQTWSFPLDVQGYIPSAAPSTLWVDLWGSSNLVEGPDHHVVVDLNGAQATDALFDGQDPHFISVELTEDPQEGANWLGLTLPLDTGAAFDLCVLNSYGLTYPRTFVARDGRLAFEATGDLFRVEGLPSADVVAYRLDGNGLAQLAEAQVTVADGLFSVAFPGSGAPATYLVSEAGALTPVIEAGRPRADITSSSAQYVMIAHPAFIAGLAQLVEARQAQGYIVRVVDVEDIYAQFSGGIFDPQAIRDYIAHAAANMGTEYVLLVGGDTNDYHDYLGLGSISFIPSLYAAIGELEKFVPVDPLYTDVDDNSLPDLAIGRLPVRTSAELALVMDKMLAYEGKDYGQTAVFAADHGFVGDSESFIAQLPAGWSTQRAHIDELGVEQSRATLLDAVNGGVALTSYVGHSGLTKWAREDLLNATTAAALTNYGRPTVVMQWGCWNTYYVEPTYNTMAHTFLLSGNQGAAAVLGPPTLSGASSQRALGEIMMPKLASPRMTIGSALQQAKAELAASQPGLGNDLLGWTILGDPTLVVQP